MKTKSVRSPGSLVVRGNNYYTFWRVKDSTGKSKAVCKALRDEHGAAITTRPEAEKAKARLMEIVAKQDQVETLRSIQHKIDDTQADIKRLQDEKNPPLALAGTWTAFLKSTERRDCGKASLQQYEIKWSQFHEWMQREHPETTLLRDITADIANAYLQSLNHGKVASATYNFHLHTLRYLFKTLKEEARLTENIWLKPKPKILVQSSRRQLTIDELQRVCGTAQGELKVLFAIGLYTGLRLGDAATLKWSEVDLRRNQICRVPNKIVRRKPNAIITIPIHPVLAHMLAEIPANERGIYVLPKTASKYLSPARTKVTGSIQKHFIACGIETTLPRETGSRPIVSVGFHSMRHTFVSLCRDANAPLAVVENIVGHHSVDMTRLYTHTSELAKQNAVALLPDYNGEAASSKPTRDELLREIIKGMTPKNLRDKALAMLAGEAVLKN
jgi:integrase